MEDIFYVAQNKQDFRIKNKIPIIHGGHLKPPVGFVGKAPGGSLGKKFGKFGEAPRSSWVF